MILVIKITIQCIYLTINVLNKKLNNFSILFCSMNGNIYICFKNGDPRLVTDNLKDFFENIKDWDAAAKLSKYALGITGSVPLILNTADNEEELQDYR